MIFKDIAYSNQKSRGSEISATFLEIMESFVERAGDHLNFAGAGITGANVETEAGRWLFMTVEDPGESLQDALNSAVMVEVVNGELVQIPREEWEAAAEQDDAQKKDG